MNTFATPELAQAWNDRQLELKLNRLQRYADAVARDLTWSFNADRADISRRLHDCVAVAKNPYDLAVLLYTFDYRQSMQLENDPYPMSYYVIAKYTDLCDQLALFFGMHNFWVTCRKHGDTEYQLLLNYYPGGLPEIKAHALEACSERHPPATPPRVVTMAPPPPVVRRKTADMSDSPHGPVTIAPPPPEPFPSSIAHAGSGSGGFIREYRSMDDAARDLARELACEAGFHRHCRPDVCPEWDSDSESEW
jgi:hypothetical protein